MRISPAPRSHLSATASAGAQHFDRQGMPQRAPKNRLQSHEASEDHTLAELWEPTIQRAHPIPAGGSFMPSGWQ